MASLVKNFSRPLEKQLLFLVDGATANILAVFPLRFIHKDGENKVLAGRSFQVNAAASPEFLLGRA